MRLPDQRIFHNYPVELNIESGKLKSVWFKRTDMRASDRIFITEIYPV